LSAYAYQRSVSLLLAYSSSVWCTAPRRPCRAASNRVDRRLQGKPLLDRLGRVEAFLVAHAPPGQKNADRQAGHGVAARRDASETMDAWRTSCPRLPVWEDAVDGGLVERVSAGQKTLVQLTGAGRDLLSAERP
jgi:hypothetical protein